MIAESYMLDMTPANTFPIVINVSQRDDVGRTISFQLFNSSGTWVLPEDAVITLEGTKPDKKAFIAKGQRADNIVTFVIRKQMTVVSGRVRCKVKVVSGEKELESAPIILRVDAAGIKEDADISKSDIADAVADATQKIVDQVAAGIPADYRVLSAQTNENTENLKTAEEKLKKLQEEVAKIKSEGVDGVLNENDVKNAVDKYMESNTVDGLFTPNNLVLYEEVGDEDSAPITAADIISEVLAQLELKSIGGYKLGLYMGSTLIDSIELEEFRASDIICTGLSIEPGETTVYGKATVELIAKATPVDCTQKVRWFSGDEAMAAVQNGTVQMTGKSGSVSIMAVCGNYRATAKITVEQYVYTDFDWQIGLISDTVGGIYSRYGDSQNMRISSAYIATPVDTEIIMTGGDSYRYTVYYYKDGKLTAPCTSWAVCNTVVTIKADEYDGFAIKVMRKSYAKWDDTYIEAFAKTISIQSA